MKNHIRKYLTVILMLLLCTVAWGQKKVYTRSVRLRDFTSRTTKVVLNGNEIQNAALRAEVSSRWTSSPFEFCTKEEYEALKGSNLFYFLRYTQNEDIVFLTFSKGGKASGDNQMDTAFELLSVPVCGSRDSNAASLVYMPAYVDIIQDFVLLAMDSESVAYGGLRAICSKRPKNTELIIDPEKAREAFLRGTAGTVVEISISPSGSERSGRKEVQYKIQISADSHNLYSYGKSSR